MTATTPRTTHTTRGDKHRAHGEGHDVRAHVSDATDVGATTPTGMEPSVPASDHEHTRVALEQGDATPLDLDGSGAPQADKRPHSPDDAIDGSPDADAPARSRTMEHAADVLAGACPQPRGAPATDSGAFLNASHMARGEGGDRSWTTAPTAGDDADAPPRSPTMEPAADVMAGACPQPPGATAMDSEACLNACPMARGEGGGRSVTNAPAAGDERATTGPQDGVQLKARVQAALALLSGTDEQKDKAAYQLHQFALGTTGGNTIVEAGGVVPLVALLNGNDKQKELAARALACLALDHSDAIVAAGGVAPLVALLNGTNDQKDWAARALYWLVHKGHADAVVATRGVSPLVVLLNGTEWQKNEAARALNRLVHQGHAEAIVEAGGVAPLVALLGGTNMQNDRAAEALKCLVRGGHADAVVASLVALLDGTDEQKEEAARVLGDLAHDHSDAIVEAGGVAPLVALLNGTDEQKKVAADALGWLARDHSDAIVEAGGVAPLVALLDGTDEQKKVAADALGNLAHDHADAIVEAGGVSPLVALLDGIDEQEENAAFALGILARDHSDAIVEAGGVAPLVALLDGTDEQKKLAANALGNLARDQSDAIVEAGGVAPLVALLSGTDEQKVKAAEALRWLVRKGHANVVVEAGGVAPLVALLSGTDEQKVKAAKALRWLTFEGHANAIVKAGGIAPLKALLSGTDEQKYLATFVLDGCKHSEHGTPTQEEEMVLDDDYFVDWPLEEDERETAVQETVADETAAEEAAEEEMRATLSKGNARGLPERSEDCNDTRANTETPVKRAERDMLRHVGTVVDVHWRDADKTYRGTIEGFVSNDKNRPKVRYYDDNQCLKHDYSNTYYEWKVVEPPLEWLWKLRLRDDGDYDGLVYGNRKIYKMNRADVQTHFENCVRSEQVWLEKLTKKFDNVPPGKKASTPARRKKATPPERTVPDCALGSAALALAHDGDAHAAAVFRESVAESLTRSDRLAYATTIANKCNYEALLMEDKCVLTVGHRDHVVIFKLHSKNEKVRTHALCTLRGKIFDTGADGPLELTRENLTRCLGVEYGGVECAYEFIPGGKVQRRKRPAAEVTAPAKVARAA